MMGGVLLFGGVSWFLHRTPEWVRADPATATKLTGMVPIVWGIAVLGLAFLFIRHRAASNPSQTSTLSILAWALGESVALFGGVVFFMTAEAVWYVAGVVVLAITFVAFPPPVNR
jgi:hypothetical protein